MGEEARVIAAPNANSGSDDDESESVELDIYPLSSYYFGSKDPIPFKDHSLADRLHRMKSNYSARGIRTCVEAVIVIQKISGIITYSVAAFAVSVNVALIERNVYDEKHLAIHLRGSKATHLVVELFKHPHLLLLQIKNSIFKLPGGRLRPGESDTNGLKRKLARKLSVSEDGYGAEWEVGECLGMWWRPDFEILQYPFLPPNINQPKECTKLFLIKLPMSRKFTVPKNLRLLAVPLCQIHENHKTYGQIISGVPQLLSKFSFNMIES